VTPSSPAPRPAPLAFEDLLALLERVHRVGEDRATARCPAHGDRSPSLSIRAGDDGRVLVHCHAGCRFAEIVAALGIEPRQLFPESDAPWRPTRPRRDPEREVREFLARLRTLRRPPDPRRAKLELELIGGLLAGGTRAFQRLPTNFSGESIRWFVLRVLFHAMHELVKQGTPRRWFSVLALARVIDEAYQEPGHSSRIGIYFWCRAAVRMARSVDDTDKAAHA
jgi:hypothetical protein